MIPYSKLYVSNRLCSKGIYLLFYCSKPLRTKSDRSPSLTSEARVFQFALRCFYDYRYYKHTNANPDGDQNNPNSWRASLYSGGSPGSDDVLITSIEDAQMPCTLYQNFPNPFQRTTTLSYALTTARLVNLKVFDIVGRELETIVNENQLPGNYQLSFTPANITSGVIFIRLWINGESVAIKKMIKME